MGVRLGADGLREYATAGESVVGILDRVAAARPERTAFVDARGAVTWQGFRAEVAALAGRLAGAGIGPGDRVALLFANGIPYTLALWAAWRLGAVAVPLNARLLPAEMGVLLSNAQPSLLLCGATIDAAVGREVAGLAGCALAVEDGDGCLLAGAPATDVPAVRLEPGTPIALMYTSGTTGRPKGVVITNRNALQNSRTCIDVIGRRPGEVELVMVPQFNITGLGSQTIPVVDAGLVGVLAPRFDPALVLELIERHRVNATVAAPTMWWRLLEDPTFPDRDLSSLRLALYGGAPMPAALFERMRRAFPGATFGNGYGLTETCSMVTYIGGDEILEWPRSVGRPLPITDVRIADPTTGEPVPDGQVGELQFRGPQISGGYWRDAEATAELLSDGWLRTGDAGSLVDGLVVLEDRLKDVIKRAGESIYSFEVEDVLYQHPAVLEAAVVGVPDSVYGQRVKAIVVLKPSCQATAEEITEFCRAQLARYKCPSFVEFRAELPRNAGGKVLKLRLQDEVATPPARGSEGGMT